MPRCGTPSLPNARAQVALRYLAALDDFAARHHLKRRRIVQRFAHAVAHVVPAETLAGADLSHRYLGPVLLSGQDLRGARLTGVTLDNADLTRACLEGADLRSADLNGAELMGAGLREANLRRANLREARLRDADLTGCILEGALLMGADLTGAVLEHVVLRETLYDASTRWPDGVDPQACGARWIGPGAELAGGYLAEARLQGLDLSGADLQRANLRDSHVNNTDLSGANLREANLVGALLFACNLAGASLDGALLVDAEYDNQTIWPQGFDPAASGARESTETGCEGMMPEG